MEGYLHPGLMVGTCSESHENLGKLKSPKTHMLFFLILTFSRDLFSSSRLCVSLFVTWHQNSEWIWSGNITITNHRRLHVTVRKSHTTIMRHKEDKLSKATSSLFLNKMIAKLEWTYEGRSLFIATATVIPTLCTKFPWILTQVILQSFIYPWIPVLSKLVY